MDGGEPEIDHLLEHKEALQDHMAARLEELFSLDYEMLLYDVTSTYFEGQALRNPMAKRGHSRDHRPDCKQVCIALVVTREGISLGYEVFDGNRVHVTTVEQIVGTMEERYGKARRVWSSQRAGCRPRPGVGRSSTTLAVPMRCPRCRAS